MNFNFISFFYLDTFYTISLILVFFCIYIYHLDYKYKKIIENNLFRVKKYKTSNFNTDYNLYIYIIFLFLILFKKYTSKETLFWFNHFYVNDLNFLIIFLFNFFIFLYFIILKFKYQNYSKSYESGLTLLFFSHSLQFLFLTSNLFTFIVFLEFQSLSLVYFLIVNNNIFNKKNYFKKYKTTNYLNDYPSFYVNSLIFNYWVSFFGSILIVFGIIFIEKILNFLDWNSINILFNFYFHKNKNYFLSIYWLPIFLGFLIKLGYVPAYIWKPEFYKGLSYETLFFFMTFYFFLFIFFFIFLFFFLLNNYISIWQNYIFIITSFTGISIVLSLFEITSIKSFLAYGTIMHITFMLTLLYNLT